MAVNPTEVAQAAEVIIEQANRRPSGFVIAILSTLLALSVWGNFALWQGWVREKDVRLEEAQEDLRKANDNVVRLNKVAEGLRQDELARKEKEIEDLKKKKK